MLPTGGSKTLTFTLPPILWDPGVSIVVAPINLRRTIYGSSGLQISSMSSNTVDRRGMPPSWWSALTGQQPLGITYGSVLRKIKLLRRIVLDECHLSFTASDYRPKLRQLDHLQVLRCLMILLTATLPPVRLDELREAMHISHFRLSRMSAVRANIRYMVRRCPNQSALELVKEWHGYGV